MDIPADYIMSACGFKYLWAPCHAHPEVMSVNVLNSICFEIIVLFLMEVAPIPFFSPNAIFEDINRFKSWFLSLIVITN